MMTEPLCRNSDVIALQQQTQFEKQKNWEISHTISLGSKKTNNFRFGYLGAQAPQGAATPPSSFVAPWG